MLSAVSTRPQAKRTHTGEDMTTTAIPTSQAALPTLIILGGVRVSGPATDRLHANSGYLGATLGTWQGTLHPLIWYAITVSMVLYLVSPADCAHVRCWSRLPTLFFYVAVTQMPLRRWCVERGSLCRLYVARGLL